MSQRFANKIALVTGGNSGIGRETALRFAREGAQVIITGRDPVSLAAVQAELGEGHLPVQADTSKLADIDALIERVRQHAGRIDTLFVNAGIAKFAPFAELSESLFDETFLINVKGAFFTIQKALPLLSDGATIVLTSSVAVYKGFPGTSAYAASKAALASFAKTLSTELLPRGIRVNVVYPGPIATPIYGRLGMPQHNADEMAKNMASLVPLGRFGESREVADAVLFLASAESSYIVGSGINVDGGMSEL